MLRRKDVDLTWASVGYWSWGLSLLSLSHYLWVCVPSPLPAGRGVQFCAKPQLSAYPVLSHTKLCRLIGIVSWETECLKTDILRPMRYNIPPAWPRGLLAGLAAKQKRKIMFADYWRLGTQREGHWHLKPEALESCKPNLNLSFWRKWTSFCLGWIISVTDRKPTK